MGRIKRPVYQKMRDKNGHQFYSDVAESVILKCGWDIFRPGRDLSFFFSHRDSTKVYCFYNFASLVVFILNFSFKIFVEWGNPFWIPFGEVEVPDTKPSNPILFPSPFTHKTLSKNQKKSLQKITLKNYHKNTAPPPIKHEMPPTWESPLVRNQLNVMTWVFFAAKKPPRNPWPPKGARLVKRGQCPKRQNSPWRQNSWVFSTKAEHCRFGLLGQGSSPHKSILFWSVGW